MNDPNASLEYILSTDHRNGYCYRINGTESWWRWGQRHRLDGPAVITLDGKIEWWIDGKQYTFDTWLVMSPLSDEQKVLFKLTYGG